MSMAEEVPVATFTLSIVDRRMSGSVLPCYDCAARRSSGERDGAHPDGAHEQPGQQLDGHAPADGRKGRARRRPGCAPAAEADPLGEVDPEDEPEQRPDHR